MKIALISFTRLGAATCRKIEAGLEAAGYECSAFGKAGSAEKAGILPMTGSLTEWTAEAFPENGAIVFVGACGIAVRAVAPHIRDKTVDPAVIVVDEKGKYAISLLSGHIGGANELTAEIAELIGAEPVITTATDLNQKFAVDGWAKKNHLVIDDMKLAKEISAAILNGETIGISSDFHIEGKMPGQLQYAPESGHTADPPDAAGAIPDSGRLPRIGLRISVREDSEPFDKTLRLIPRTVTVGIGCRKGSSFRAAEELLTQVMREHRLSKKSVEKLCTIDLKKEEPALKVLADRLGVPLQAFSAEELKQLTGQFTASGFVNQNTGVDNVCERAAVMGSLGELIVGKQARDGVTVAIAVRKEGYIWTQQRDREG